ncbi:MAG TPA: xanthine dehydrogenase family protein molybdopterin-binding subunit [Candidatus Acidoferrales bacterium]|nr:xanthine dehydrogenase family protein molybdopterin-binding subunit [Candidatus Acidoferrales bacterium]
MKAKRAFTVAGAAAPRLEGLEKVTGEAIYTGDLDLPGMCFAKVLRSPLPHARIVNIDARRAERVPGCLLVLTRNELAGIQYVFGAIYKDQTVVAVDKVRYVGDPVAAVAAEDEEAAEEALGLIDVEYEELPAVTDIEQAIAPGAPLVHETVAATGELRASSYDIPQKFKGTNICYHFGYSRGNVEAAFEKSAHVFEDTFYFQKVQHCSLEPHVNIAHFAGDKLTVWSASQDPFTLRENLAGIFGLPLSRVRVIVPYVGGGYGGKLYVKAEPISAALSWKLQRPVKLALSMGESFKTVTRHPARVRIKSGVARDGRLIARDCEIYMDTGAYADAGPRVTQKAGYRALGPYRIPHARVNAYCVYTNTVPAGAFRGFGGVQVAWAYESHTDAIAQRLGIDPLDFRLKNFLKKGELYTAGDTPIDCDLKEGLLKVAKALDWKAPAKPNRGKGLSCCIKDAGGTYKVAGATVKMSADGSAVLLTGTVEIGQGALTALSQVVAEELGLSLNRVSVAQLDTDVTPYDISTSASSSMTVMGLAVQRAAQDVKRQLLRAAANVLKTSPKKLTLGGGKVRGPRGAVPYASILTGYFGSRAAEIIGHGLYQDRKSKKAVLGSPTTFWEVGWGGAEVAVDPETGVVEVLKYFSVSDAGKVINPTQCIGQDEGGILFGLGHTLYEQMVYEDGQVLNPNLVDYRVPTFRHLPKDLESVFLENGNGPGPFGAKGLGEGGLLPVAAAIGNAVARATGVRIYQLPLTPGDVWRALSESKKAPAGQKSPAGWRSLP